MITMSIYYHKRSEQPLLYHGDVMHYRYGVKASRGSCPLWNYKKPLWWGIFIIGGERGMTQALPSPFGSPSLRLAMSRASRSAWTQRGFSPSYTNKKTPLMRGFNIWRWERDSNPRNAINAYTLSRRAPSATRTPHRKLLPFSIL